LKNLTNADIVSLILEEDTNITEDEELIHMLLDKTISKNINNSNRNSLSFGDKISDKIAEIAGSWYFIISFSAVIFFWIILNVVILLKPFDIYPFILLNLVLSCIAALQAPVIMMSQNRQEKKDRIRSENDYKVNLKSELIIEDLHVKLDRLIINQEQIIKRLDSIDNNH
jgi:uncharacterized membrane protein